VGDVTFLGNPISDQTPYSDTAPYGTISATSTTGNAIEARQLPAKFREPGVLFELATDPPGFAIDEPVQTLGQTLNCPFGWNATAKILKRHPSSYAIAQRENRVERRDSTLRWVDSDSLG
jgi:hypothetical protein